jgi:hypothetical protein
MCVGRGTSGWHDCLLVPSVFDFRESIQNNKHESRCHLLHDFCYAVKQGCSYPQTSTTQFRSEGRPSVRPATVDMSWLNNPVKQDDLGRVLQIKVSAVTMNSERCVEWKGEVVP